MDWLSRFFEMITVRGRLDQRCLYGAPWRIEQGPGGAGEIPCHAVVGGSAVLEDPTGGRPLQLKVGDILLLPENPRHVIPRRKRRAAAARAKSLNPQSHGQRERRHGRAARPALRPLCRCSSSRSLVAQLFAEASCGACRRSEDRDGALRNCRTVFGTGL